MIHQHSKKTSKSLFAIILSQLLLLNIFEAILVPTLVERCHHLVLAEHKLANNQQFLSKGPSLNNVVKLLGDLDPLPPLLSTWFKDGPLVQCLKWPLSIAHCLCQYNFETLVMNHWLRTEESFEKFQNAMFFKISKIPSIG